jgi:hypothetical protein
MSFRMIRILAMLALMGSAGCMRAMVNKAPSEDSPYDTRTEVQKLEDRLGV